jgi:hypothetical protein
LNWDNQSADTAKGANAINDGRKVFFWILADKLEELIKAGENYNATIR